jgi:hypothetical protein
LGRIVDSTKSSSSNEQREVTERMKANPAVKKRLAAMLEYRQLNPNAPTLTEKQSDQMISEFEVDS